MLGLDWNLKGRFKNNLSRHWEVQPGCLILWWWSWNVEWYCVTWQAATVGTWRLLHCAFQATKSEKCQGNFFTVFHMQRGRKKRRRSPMLLLRQGRRQTGPPSSECEFPGPDAGAVFLCSPCGGSLWIQKSLCLKQQILVHLLQTQPGKKEKVMSK